MKRNEEFMTDQARAAYEEREKTVENASEKNEKTESWREYVRRISYGSYRGRLFFEGSRTDIVAALARILPDADDLDVVVEFRTGPRE